MTGIHEIKQRAGERRKRLQLGRFNIVTGTIDRLPERRVMDPGVARRRDDTAVGVLPLGPGEKATKVLRLTARELAALPEYSCSLPTGTTQGKTWKRNTRWSRQHLPPKWVVGEYGPTEGDTVPIDWHEVEIVEATS